MSKFLLPAMAGVSAIAFAAPAFAAPAQITIYALKSPLALSRIATSATVITRDEIERENRQTVVELLRDVPGLTVAGQGSAGQPSSVFMRGANSNHVLVVVDGVVVNDPSNPSTAFDFSNLTTDNVERIEILRGPQSAIYGSQAMGGVINIISRKGAGKPAHTAMAEAGRYHSGKVAAGTSGEAGRTSYSLQVGAGHTDGVSALAKRFGGREKDGTDTQTVAMNLISRMTETFAAKFNVRYNRTDAEFDNPASALGRPMDDPGPENDSRQLNARVAGELSLLDGRWTQEFGVSYLHLSRSQITEFFDPFFTAYFGHQQYVSWRETADWVHHFKPVPDHLLTVGTEISSEHYKLNGIPQTALAESNVDNRAIFVDDNFTVGENFFMNAGIRNDYHQSFGRNTTWKLAPGYRVPMTGTTLKATYGTGFKAPSLYSLYDATYGTPTLKPETSRGYDAGFEQPLMGGRVTVGSTWFHNSITNLLDTVETPPGSFIYKYVNIGKARTQGVETVLTWNPRPDVSLKGSHTFTQADNMLSDVQLRRRPKHQANASGVYQYGEEGDVGMNVRYVGRRRDADLNFALTDAKAFTTVDLFTNYHLNGNVTVYGRLDNALDKRYEEVYGYGQPGRALFVGTKAKF